MKMMKLGIVLCLGALAASAHAQMIYKCVVGGAISYQQTPCEAPTPAKGADSNTALVGKWRYDRDATMAWMKGHDTMTKAREAEFNGLGGHVTYTFTQNSASNEVTDYDVTLATGVLHRKGTRRVFPYTVLSASPQLVSVSAQNPDTLSMYTTDFHFEGHDTVWISLANQRLTAVDDAAARVYFKRER